jgi:acyl carrier protein
MKRAEILGILENMVNDINEGKVHNVTEQSNLLKDLGMDSINLVNLQVMIEDEFHIYFNPMEDNLTETFETMHSLIDKIEEKTGRNNG